MAEFEEEKVAKIIDKFLRKGYSKEELRAAMLAKGYPMRIIDDVFADIGEKPKAKIRMPHIGMPRIKPRFLLMPLVILLILVLAFFFWPDSCKDRACLIEKANNCEKAVLEEDFEGSTILYIADSCKLTKKIAEFSNEEPQEIIGLFKGKEMGCSYEKGKFDDSYLGLFGNIEICEGELKDAIYELRIAQYEILGE